MMWGHLPRTPLGGEHGDPALEGGCISPREYICNLRPFRTILVYSYCVIKHKYKSLM